PMLVAKPGRISGSLVFIGTRLRTLDFILVRKQHERPETIQISRTGDVDTALSHLLRRRIQLEPWRQEDCSIQGYPAYQVLPAPIEEEAQEPFLRAPDIDAEIVNRILVANWVLVLIRRVRADPFQNLERLELLGCCHHSF